MKQCYEIIEMLLTLLMTDSCASTCRMSNHTPMSSARSATGLRVSHTNLCASKRISIQLLSRAKSGARGKAHTKMVMKPNWRTAHASVYIRHTQHLHVHPIILLKALTCRTRGRNWQQTSKNKGCVIQHMITSKCTLSVCMAHGTLYYNLH